LAADSGARRGELAVLRMSDFDDRVLTIERGLSQGQLASTKATHLVDAGKLLKAQARLGHRDPSTTLRDYSHAVPLDDRDVADEIDALLNGGPP
jgi:integrase